MSNLFTCAPRREGVVVTPAFTSHLGQHLLTRLCRATCLPRLHSPWYRLGTVAANARETEREYIEAALPRALRHDSSTC